MLRTETFQTTLVTYSETVVQFRSTFTITVLGIEDYFDVDNGCLNVDVIIVFKQNDNKIEKFHKIIDTFYYERYRKQTKLN